MTANREIDSILQRGADGGRITPDEALLLYTEAPFHALGEAADTVRRRRYPDGIVTYLIDRNINYTNVCVTACKFCAFFRAPKHKEGWSHPTEEILRRCGELGFVGSPTVRVDGRDVQPPGDEPVGLTCRVYRRRDGRISPTPDPHDLAEALRSAA